MILKTIVIGTLLASNVAFADSFKMSDRSEGQSRNEADCSFSEKNAQVKAVEKCSEVGINNAVRVSKWTQEEGQYHVRGHLYDFGYTVYYCEVSASFKCAESTSDAQ